MAAEVDCSKEAVQKQLRVLDSTSASSRERVRAMETLEAIGKARRDCLPDPNPLLKSLRWLLTSKNLWTRCQALRIVRAYAHDTAFMQRAWDLKLDWFVARSMDRSSEQNKKLEKERDAAYSVAQRCIELLMLDHKAHKDLTEGVLPRPAAQQSPNAGLIPTGSYTNSIGGSWGKSPQHTPFPQSLSNSPVPSLVSNTPPFHGHRDSQDYDAHPSDPTTPRDASKHAPQPPLPRGIVQRIMSPVENNDEAFMRRCVLMLRDLLISSPQSIANANAMRTIIAALTCPELSDLQPGIVWALLYSIENPSTRAIFRLQYDFQLLFAPFTEKLGRDATDMKKRQKCSKDALLLFFRSWVGLIYLASDPRGLKPLVDILRLPGPTFRKMAIFEILHQAIVAAAPSRGIPLTGPWTDYVDDDVNIAAKPADFVHTHAHKPHRSDNDASDSRKHASQASACVGYSSLDIFLGALLLVFEKTGLTETLISLIRAGMSNTSAASDAAVATQASGLGQTASTGKAPNPGKDEPGGVLVSQSAAQLLQTLLRLSSSMFPGESSYKLYGGFDRTIAELFASAGHGPGGLINNAKVCTVTTALFHRISYSSTPHKDVRLDSIKLQMASNMEDRAFWILLNDSQVMTTKDYVKWHCDSVLFLIQGPLRLHTRLVETLQTKFFKRLLSFMKPRRMLFAKLSYQEEKLIYSAVACGLVELLLQSTEGVQFLSASGLLEEIQGILCEVTSRQVPEQDKVLNKENVMYSMAREYFKIIGKFSESPVGVELLQKYHIFASLRELMAKGSSIKRDDICQQILKHLNFGRVGNQPVNKETRQIFSSAMTEGSRPIRLFATLQLKSSFRLGYKDSVDWALDLLVAQLSDSWREVVKAAHEIINDWCMMDDDVLDSFVDKKPGMQMFTRKEEKDAEEHAQRLLLRMVARDSGFEYLHGLGVVQGQITEWKEHKAVEWVVKLEGHLSKYLMGGDGKPGGDLAGSTLDKGDRRTKQRGADTPASSVVFTPHLFGEIAKTHQGAECLLASSILTDYATTINDAISDDSSSSPLWATPQAAARPDPTPILPSKPTHKRQPTQEVFEDEMEIRDVSDPLISPKGHVGDTPTASSWQPPKLQSGPEIKSLYQEARYHHKSEVGCGMKVKNSLGLRSALWAIAHIASSDTGFGLLQKHPMCGNLIAKMVRMAMSSDCISLRGTMMCALSVVGHSAAGRAALSTLGWVTNHSEGYTSSDGDWYGMSFSYPMHYEEWAVIHTPQFTASPCDLIYSRDIGADEKARAERLFQPYGVTVKNASEHFSSIEATFTKILEKKASVDSVTRHDLREAYGVLLASYHRYASRTKGATRSKSGQVSAHTTVLDHVRSMSNPVMVDGAGKSLKKIMKQDPSIYHDPFVTHEIHELLNTFRYRLMARRYLYDTFVDQAIYTHEAFAYLDTRFLPYHVAPPPENASPTTLMIDVDHTFSGRERVSPSLKPHSPSLSRQLPTNTEAYMAYPTRAYSNLVDALLRGDVGNVTHLVNVALASSDGALVRRVVSSELFGWSNGGFPAPLTPQAAQALAMELRRLRQ
eukprot:TRINITY_DN18325_c0_g1_i1.p1 TRINITY_DN18325_c0_g1~~TRINITY_DN18325_c0_g1_i1.p1  ORF type:complete len:1589 (+),score=580.31 TRINITY_DN18325_c0_g1_i1:89-4768(+)